MLCQRVFAPTRCSGCLRRFAFRSHWLEPLETSSPGASGASSGSPSNAVVFGGLLRRPEGRGRRLYGVLVNDTGRSPVRLFGISRM
jgi:hypothetical protein